MTTEEKARAYDEALERAKNALRTDLHESGVRAIQRIFPQLAESEDERIINAIISFLRVTSFYSCNGCKKPEILAWLEKQKEQKPILEVFGFKVGDAVRLKDGDGRKHIIKSIGEVEGLHGPNFYHVEFEDNSARDGIYPGEEYPNGYYTQMEKIEEEQKTAGWSEEDDWKRKELIQYLEEKGDYRTVWMTWLKSLRPSWKPSEEQKEALEYVIRDYREDCCNATANYLQEILDHLKNM